MERIELASSQFPSGVAWLLNFFVENNILIYRGKNIKNTWLKDGKMYKLRENEEVLKQWIPCLSEREKIDFGDKIAIRWSHEFPNFTNTHQKVILLVRDGRDCIFSQFKREKKFQNFAEMLNSKIEPFGLLPAETWALHGHWWLKTIPFSRLFVIKFEEIKSNPFPVLKRLIDFLDIKLADADIRRGIESSSFDRAKKAEEEYRKKSVNVQFGVVNRRGVPGEWCEVYTDKELNFFNGFPNSILKIFNYDVGGLSNFSKRVFLQLALCVLLNKIKTILFWPIGKGTVVYKKLFS